MPDFRQWLITIDNPAFPLRGSFQIVSTDQVSWAMTTFPEWPGSAFFAAGGTGRPDGVDSEFSVSIPKIPARPPLPEVPGAVYTFVTKAYDATNSAAIASGTVTIDDAHEDGTWSGTAQTGTPIDPNGWTG